MTDEPEHMSRDDEPYADWAKRVYTEAAAKQGMAVGFLIWCMTNYYEMVLEFKEYDRQMRATGIFVATGERNED